MSGPLDSAKVPTAVVVGGTYNAVSPAPADGQSLSLQQDANGNLLVNVAVGGGGGGSTVTGTKADNTVPPGSTNLGVLPAVANAVAPTRTEGDQVLLSTDLSANLRTITEAGSTTAVSGNVTVVQPTGTSLHTVTDTGSTTAVTGTVTTSVTGTVTVAGNKTNNNAAPGATNEGTLPAVANAASPTWVEGNQVAESVDLTGRQRVRGTLTGNTAAPDADAQSTLNYVANAAAPTWVEGNLVLGSVDLNGNTRIIGTKTNNNAAPTTQVAVMPALANAISPTWTEGDQVLESVDLRGGQRCIAGNVPELTASWTSATALNTALQINTIGFDSIVVTLNQGSTITGGVVTFEFSDTTAFTNVYQEPVARMGPSTASIAAVVSYNLVANINQSFVVNCSGWAAFRVRLSTVIAGTGTVNVGLAASAGTSILTTAVVAAGLGVASTLTGQAPADNRPNVDFFADSAGNANVLWVGDSVYGGAFSGAADATRSGWTKMRSSTIFRTVAATASGNTAIWTPGSGNKFRLLKLFIQVTDNASLASGGVLTVDIQDSSTTTNITFSVFVPTTAVTTVIGDGAEYQLDLGQIGILSAAANNVLNVNLSSALVTGVCRIIAQGTEE